MVYSFDVILLSSENEGATGTYSNMDELYNIIMSKRSQRQEFLLYDSVYIEFKNTQRSVKKEESSFPWCVCVYLTGEQCSNWKGEQERFLGYR